MKHPWLTSVLVAVSMAAGACRLAANQVDLSLNLLYSDPTDDQSVGEWQLVARTTGLEEHGIVAANVNLRDLDLSPTFHTPQGEVGGELVGFVENRVIDFGSHKQLAMAQLPNMAGSTQPLFYDVGAIGGGTIPGDVGPGFTFDPDTTRNIPWGMPDPLDNSAWDGAVLLASGSFNSGLVPGFYSDAGATTRSLVFTDIGGETTPGQIVEAAVTTVVRDNLIEPVAPDGDYNNNGRVEQADLDLVLLNWNESVDSLPDDWVHQRPTTGIVDQAELDNVLLNWNQTAGGLGAAQGVPEPSAAVLLAIAAALGWRFRSAQRTSQAYATRKQQ